MTKNNMKNFLIKLIHSAIVFISALSILMAAPISQAGDSLVKIGVLARRGPMQCLENWYPTAEYLTAKIRDKIFMIEPLDFEEIYSAVENGKVDFVLANSSIYVELESLYGVNRVATLKNLRFGVEYTTFRGIIFFKANRSDLLRLEDIKGRTFMAVEESSLGGWRAAWREFKDKGIDPYHDFKELSFGGTHDAVVYAVRDGKVDAGTVRSDILERMAVERKIDILDFCFIKEHRAEGDIPVFYSTRQYPEWPFAKVRHTLDELAAKVATALIMMPRDCPAAKAANCAGWTIPLNYQPVHECLKELKIGPYKGLGKIAFADVYAKYRYWILTTGFLFAVFAGAALFILRLNRNIKTSHVKLKSEIEVRNRTEEALRESEEKYRNILETTVDGYYEVDLAGNFTFFNNSLCKIFGYTEHELLGMNNRQFTGKETAGKVFEAFNRVYATGKSSKGFEWDIIEKDGSKRYIAASISLIKDAKGKPIGFRGTIRDITEKKLVEAALENERKQFISMFDGIDEVVYVADPHTHEILYMNDPAKKHWGDGAGKKCHKVLQNLDSPCPFCTNDRIFGDNTGVPYIWEFQNTVNQRWYRCIDKAIHWPDGRTVRFEIAIDINDRKMANQELAKTNKDLEEAIERANMMAVEAEISSMAKSEFLANMSHEIRTPMNAILGFSDMLLDTELKEEQADFIGTIKRSGESLLSLINDILDFSKIEAGQMDFEDIAFDPELLAYDVCELIRPRIESKPIEILCRIGENVPSMVKGDPTRFRQVLTNLMGNAPKFTDAGEIELSLEVEKETETQIMLHAKIRDTGIGVPQDKLGAIFEPFRQADGSTTRKYGGTGLGLSICRKISELLNGDVWAESNAECGLDEDSEIRNTKPEIGGTGSIFHFTAWLGKTEEKEVGTFAPVSLSDKKALVVDDNRTNLDILTHVLDSVEMRVVALTKGEDVVPTLKSALADGKPFDCCILDIQMPGISGYHVAKQIRNLKSSIKSIPLLVLSSLMERDSRKCEEAGFNGFLNKPIRREKLYKMLERLLGEKKDKWEKAEAEKQKIITQYSVREDMKHSVHILLAEDNAVNQKLAKMMLTKAGYQVDVANNGKEAVERYTRSPEYFDLILMDVQMPEMDGLKATKKIRKIETGDPLQKSSIINRQSSIQRIPIIAMTANAMKGDREVCLDAGMDDYMSKPIKREIIFEILEKWVFRG